MIQGGATGAAALVHMSQPAVSRILKEFEEIVGFPLFERERTGLRPTAEARALFLDVDRAHTAFEHVAETAKAIRHKEQGQLRVAAIAVDVDGLLSREVGNFLKKWPGIRFQMSAATKPDIEKLVATEQVDIGILTLPITGRLVKIRQRHHRQAVCICPQEHPLAPQKTVSLDELLAHHMIHLVPGSPLRMALDNAMSAKGLVPEIRTEMETQRAVVNMVCQGAGCAIVDPALLTVEETHHLAIRPLQPALSWTQAVITPHKAKPSRIAEEFLSWLEDIYEGQEASGNKT